MFCREVVAPSSPRALRQTMANLLVLESRLYEYVFLQWWILVELAKESISVA